jgi:membrane-bound ClpP family serine protease
MFKKWTNLLLLLFGLLYVPTVFKFIQPKQVAALYAGVFFILLGFILMYMENKRQRLVGVTGLLAVIFTFFFAIPIFYMRVSHWSEPFDSLNVLGVPLKLMHSVSSILYVVIFLVELVRLIKPNNKYVR